MILSLLPFKLRLGALYRISVSGFQKSFISFKLPDILGNKTPFVNRTRELAEMAAENAKLTMSIERRLSRLNRMYWITCVHTNLCLQLKCLVLEKADLE